ncbi:MULTISPECIES: hypothetical protein [unclassified Streptomyces]
MSLSSRLMALRRPFALARLRAHSFSRNQPLPHTAEHAINTHSLD